MRRLVVLALLLPAGCPAGDTPPPGGGGGGGTGGGGGGGGADGGYPGDGGARLAGRLCAAVDLRIPLACPAADLAGIDLAAGGASDTTGAGGTFALDLDPAVDHLVAVSGGDPAVRDALLSTAMWSGADGLRAPVVTLSGWDDLVASIGAFEPDGTASLALYLEDDSGPIAGAEVVPPDGSSQMPFYDGTSPTDWDPNGLTGIYGAAILLGVPSLNGTVELGIAVDAATYTVTVPVQDDRLTFARVVLDTSGA